MEQPLSSATDPLRRPSAFLPLAMSVLAIAILVTYLITHGVTRDPDEGALAHLWQILMAGQLPIIFSFAATGLRRAPRQTLRVLALQATAFLASMAPVLYFNL